MHNKEAIIKIHPMKISVMLTPTKTADETRHERDSEKIRKIIKINIFVFEFKYKE